MAALDHVVINTLKSMDAAADLFAALGFTLTPRGTHSLGSINHLMMTPGAYLELVGVPDTGRQRQEVLDSPFGLNGLVLRTFDADATRDTLAAAGFAPTGPVAFSRPVEVDGVEHDARFCTVRLPPETFPAGRVYFCEHLTPELVWRDEWMTHPNGFCAIDAFTIASPHPEAEARRLASAFASVAEPDGAGWRVPLDDADVRVVPGDKAAFRTATLRFSSLDDIAARANALRDVRWEALDPDAGVLSLPAFDLNLTCRSS
ncbi:VOC family protein [Xanthobacter wiegelii]|uniref:VOC family protein n=1 Tax=Xanthobacter wiegelii TaxID=3119913 RepID=UPI0037299E17